MNECSKSKQHWGALEKQATQGNGIDIGCGPDPVTPDARPFDIEHGDANVISEFIKEQFDFVYSSHCLEHMRNPAFTILEWWKLVKPGGYLFVVVPDEDLYEQGVFPSRFNSDHKATFTISKSQSWSPVSFNVIDLANSLPGGELLSLQLQDWNYDRRLLSFGCNKPAVITRIVARAYMILGRAFAEEKITGILQLLAHCWPVDQTGPPFEAQAQIQLIARKILQVV
jgi:SAM-dependent methyltransferase